MMARKVFVMIAIVGLLLTSGCTALTEGAIQLESTQTEFPTQTKEATGFVTEDTENQIIERELTIGPQTYDVFLTSHRGTHHKVENGSSVATVIAHTSPNYNILGNQANPLKEYTTKEATIATVGESDRIRNVTKESDYGIKILGEKRTVTRFTATLSRENMTTEIYIESTKFTHKGETVFLAGTYSQNRSTAHTDVKEMLQNTQFPDQN